MSSLKEKFQTQSMECQTSGGWIKIYLLIFSNMYLVDLCSSFLDGHSSHYTLELIKIATEKNVVIFFLLPHTTANSELLDTSVFGPLKLQAYHDYMFRQFCHQIPVSSLFRRAWLKGMSIDNICAGFKTDFEELFRIHNHSWQSPRKFQKTSQHHPFLKMNQLYLFKINSHLSSLNWLK